jgi:hypothetical protein
MVLDAALQLIALVSMLVREPQDILKEYDAQRRAPSIGAGGLDTSGGADDDDDDDDDDDEERHFFLSERARPDNKSLQLARCPLSKSR